jgi:PleD family two-component response regulator
MLLLPCALERAEQGAAQLLTEFSDITFPAAGHQTVSIGVTQAIPGENLDALLVRVDKALYQAKKTGKNRYVIL